MLKRVFMAGAPGSKWSSVAKNIYYSPSVDRSDFSDARTYYHSAWGQPELMHLGAYFDPGMEFGKRFMRLPQMTPKDIEAEFDRPFSGQGVRIIKSHVFAHHLNILHQFWDHPIVLVYRPNDACLGWWVRCGQFDITYPNYQYYGNLEMMAMHIDQQNQDILDFANKHGARWDAITDNKQLADRLGLEQPPDEYYQSYPASDIEVTVI